MDFSEDTAFKWCMHLAESLAPSCSHACQRTQQTDHHSCAHQCAQILTSNMNALLIRASEMPPVSPFPAAMLWLRNLLTSH